MKLYTMLPNQDWSWLSRWLIHLAWWVVSWQRWIFPRKLIFCQGPGQWQLLFLAKQILKNFKGPLKDYLRTCKGPLKDYWRTIKAIRAIYRIVRPLGLVLLTRTLLKRSHKVSSQFYFNDPVTNLQVYKNPSDICLVSTQYSTFID